MSRVFVLGSMNMDTFLLVDEFVRPGQTIQARAAKKLPGGKGFNQAVAAARMGVDTLMVGSLGADSDGRAMRESASAEHCLDTSRVLEVKAHGTSVAMIQIDNSGENSIVVAPGANQVNDVPSVEARLHDIGPGDVLVCQLEIPVDAVAAGLALACNAGATTILNAAPGMAVGDLLGDVNLLIVNQTEAETILGTQMEGAAQAIHSRYGSNVIVTLGAEGCHVVTVDSSETLPAVAAEVVDTTGAGDAFVGAVAAAIAEGRSLVEAAQYGTALAAYACQSQGAQGYPERRAEVEELVAQYQKERSWND